MANKDGKIKASLLKREISSIMRELLGEQPTLQILETLCPDEFQRMARNGDRATIKTYAELIAGKILRFAVQENKANVWAIDTVLDRIEGKLGTGTTAGNSNDDNIESKLDAATQAQINRKAEKLIERYAKPEEKPAGPSVAGQTDMSDDGNDHSQRAAS